MRASSPGTGRTAASVAGQQKNLLAWPKRHSVCPVPNPSAPLSAPDQRAAHNARMRSLLFFALLLFGWGNTAQAQAYRCGNSYSDAPCPNGRSIDLSPQVSDPDGARTSLIYLCRQTGNRLVWSAETCSTSGMALERTERVPAHLDWDQQVTVANRLYAQARAITAPRPAVRHSAPRGPSRQAQCQALEERIRHLDSMGRAGSQHHDLEWVRSERKKARDGQFRLQCS